MKYVIRLRDNTTGEVRDCPQDHDGYDAESIEFYWTDGNFGCDCNRRWEFQRAGGEGEDENPPCDNERYTAIEAVLEDGTRVPLDTRA